MLPGFLVTVIEPTRVEGFIDAGPEHHTPWASSTAASTRRRSSPQQAWERRLRSSRRASLRRSVEANGARAMQETVLQVPIACHVFETTRAFPDVLEAVYTGISRPDIGELFDQLSSRLPTRSSRIW